MEDETRLTSRPAGNPDNDVVRVDPDATITSARPDAGAGAAPDPSMTRAQIEKTRARMSETIDEIEDVLVRKKEQIQDRLDVLAPVRERPLAAMGVVLGAGVVLGLLTGGSDHDDRHVHTHHSASDEELEERAETWERRARRLMRIAREQEEELNALSTGRAVRISERWDEDEDADRDGPSEPSQLDHFRDEVAERVTEFVTGALRGMFGGGSNA